ncbi:predicted transcriptional regulator [Aeropyrum camini SY1 = JCM 12091]|uniref:Predicted transcriptional regulator n=2 Tax=Aeropyrum camini TaxID=229980 RepID=U3TC32_9CREN|nr:predicted transcriptional regulator [Aeropyrum camini SY1 = JCM 12091]
MPLNVFKPLFRLSHGVVGLVSISSLKPHEEIEGERLHILLEDIKRRRLVVKPILVDAKTLVILDGHHRFNALKILGARYAPAVLVDYDSPCVSVGSWREGVSVSKEEVRRRGVEGRLYPPRTSRHRVCFEIPDVNATLEELAGDGVGSVG